MNKKLKNSGITLISLVITIIIMLILVGVSINLAVNGGLFEYAGNAVGDTKNAMKNEQDLVNTIIDDYIKKYTGEKEHEWYIDEEGDGDTFKCKKHPEEIYTIGDRVDYTATPGTTKIYFSKLGWTSDQELYGKEATITTQTQDVVWRVLGIDEDTGSLLITTDGGVGFFAGGEEFDDEELIDFPIYIDGNFGSVEGFNNGPSEMNRICKELYSNSEYGYAQSMTIEDVNKVLQHNQPGGIATTYLPERITYENGFGKMKDTTLYNTMKNAGWDKTPDGRDIGEYNIDGYTYKLGTDSYLEDPYGTKFELMTSDLRLYMAFYCLGDSEVIESTYWLASRGMDMDYIDGVSFFGIGEVSGRQASSYSHVMYMSWGLISFDEDAGDSIDMQPLRPVVYCNKSKLPKKVSSLYDDLGIN